MQIKTIAASALILTALTFAGCGKKEEAPAVVAPVTTEAPVAAPVAAPAATEAPAAQ